MLLPVSRPSEPGGAAGVSSRYIHELLVAPVPPGMTGLPDHRGQPKPPAEEVDQVVALAPGLTGGGTAEPNQALSRQMARWEPIARALGSAAGAIEGFLQSVGVPQAQAEAMARQVAGAAREQMTIDRRATQAQFEEGRLSLKLENVRIGLGRDRDEDEIAIGKAEIGIDVDVPGARQEKDGTSLGEAEAEIGQRTVGFEYKGPGATPAYADRGASAVTFTVAAPLPAPEAPTGAVKTGPVDVAI